MRPVLKLKLIMKNTLTITAASVALVAAANADFLAGWDFENINSSQDLSSLSANFGDFAGNGSLASLDTSNFFQQTDIDPNLFGGGVAPRFAGNTQEVTALGNSGATATGVAAANGMSINGTTGQGLTFQVDSTNASPTFSFDVDFTGYEFESFQFQHAEGASFYSNLLVEVSAGGSSATIGNYNPGAGFAFVDVTSLGLSVDNQDATFSFTLTGTDGLTSPSAHTFEDGFFIDNVTFSGNVVPEPSTYAAIFGAVALAFAGARRRK